MSKAAFSVADLQSAQKKLNEVPEEKASRAPAKEDSNEYEDYLISLYNRHDGDLDLIFGELNENPAKAKKPHHRPKNAQEFATKYSQGFYSIIEGDDDSESKNSGSNTASTK